MPDERSLIEKLQAMSSQSASPQEAEVARLLLGRMQRGEAVAPLRTHPVRAAGIESPRVISRARIMATPDRDSPVRTVRWRTRTAAGAWTWINADLDDFELDESGHLRYGG